jgi:ribosome-associated translation inhibitor RaiA
VDFPLDITTRDTHLSDRNAALIRTKAEGLQKYYSRMTGCRVVIDGPGDRHRSGGPFKVRVELEVPGTNLVVDKQVAEDIESAIRSAFDAARRQVQDYARVQRGQVKSRSEDDAGE